MEWIDVNKELPRAADINNQGTPYSDEVLVAYTETFLNRRQVCAAIMRGPVWKDRFEDTLDDVTHWAYMPIAPPAPPERSK